MGSLAEHEGKIRKVALRRLATALLPVLGAALSVMACGGGDADGEKQPSPPADLGTPDSGAKPDLGPEDLGCVWHPIPNCPAGQHAVQDPPRGECEDGPWHCEDCPDERTFPPCPLGQSHQVVDGCKSPVVCDCSITREPRCPEGQVPQRACDGAGKCCLTGACGVDCPWVEPPDCSIWEEEERDARGCLTGNCRRLPCAEVETPECLCGWRPAHDAGGCITGACEEEPVACTVEASPQCPDGKVPEVTRQNRCLTGRCVAGACVGRCQSDFDCSSSDVCLEYLPGCMACFPRSCVDFRDCPNYTDCLENRCKLREAPTCQVDADCGEEGLVCDAVRCGACEQYCECRGNEDCGEGMRCADCACVPGCRSDGDCILPQRCHLDSGECRGCACQRDDQCPAGEYCNGCFCATGCRLDDECPPWRICSMVTHRCEPDVRCHRRGDCRLGQRCVDGRCIAEPGMCAGGADFCEPFFDTCSCDFVCARPQERPGQCSRDCGNDPVPYPPMCLCTEQGCVYGECDGPAGPACPAPYHCSKRQPGYVLSAGVCREGRPPDRQLCRVNADCVPENCCRPTHCVRADDAACRTGLDCDDQQECRPAISGCRCEESVCITEYRMQDCP